MAYDILSFRQENQDECPNCGVRWAELSPQANVYPHFTGECGKGINETLRGVAVSSFYCGVCKESGVPCDFCIDYTFDARIPEVTTPPAKKPSKVGMWCARLFWIGVILMLCEDLRELWWVSVLNR